MPPTGSAAAAHAPVALSATSTPNQFHLSGGGLSVSYFPDGSGPVTTEGRLTLTYQDAHHSRSFFTKAVRTTPTDDLGAVVSVTLITSIDTGYTTFSLLVPTVNLPAGGAAAIQAEGITTIHRVFVGQMGHAQVETYVVTPLSGTAAAGVLPDVTF